MTIRPIINVRDDKLSRGFLSAVKFCHEISVSEDQDISLSGISFVMTAMFVVIFLDQWMKEKSHASSMIGLLVSLICLILFGADSFMIPTMITIVFLLTVLRKWLEQCDKLKEKEDPTK